MPAEEPTSTSPYDQVTTDGGVLKRILKEGKGDVAPLHATCLGQEEKLSSQIDSKILHVGIFNERRPQNRWFIQAYDLHVDGGLKLCLVEQIECRIVRHAVSLCLQYISRGASMPLDLCLWTHAARGMLSRLWQLEVNLYQSFRMPT